MNYKTYHGIVFGSSKAGKSNLINQLTKSDELKVSSDPYGQTKDCESVDCFKNNNKFIFWDTPGLFETDCGTVSNKEAFTKILCLLKDIDDKYKLSFAIFVFKDILKENDKEYLKLFKEIFNKEVKILIVITHQYDFVSQEDPTEERYELVKKSLNSLGVKYQLIPVSFEKVDYNHNTDLKNIQIQKNQYKSYDSCWRALSIFNEPEIIIDKKGLEIGGLNQNQIKNFRYEGLAYKLFKYIVENYKKLFKSLKKEKQILKNLGFSSNEISNIIKNIKKK